MFKLFENKEEKASHFMPLIGNEDYSGIIEKMEQGYAMNSAELSVLDQNVLTRIQNEGITFLSDLYKEGFDIHDEWLLRWTKTKKFVTNYNLPVFGHEYFKERLEKLAPTILNFYLDRLDNLSLGIARSYKVGFIQAVEVLTSVRNYAKIVEHIESGISDTTLSQYVQKIKHLNNMIEKSPSFYNEVGNSSRVSDCLHDLEYIMQRRGILKKDNVNVKEKSKQKHNEQNFVVPYYIQDYIERIYENYEKCLQNRHYLKHETIELLDKIKNEKVLFLMNKFKVDEDKNAFSNELKKIESAISSVLVGINKQKMEAANKDYFLVKALKMR